MNCQIFKYFNLQIILFFLILNSPFSILHSQCPKLGFYDIRNNNLPYKCNTTVALESYDTISANGYVNPGFTFVINPVLYGNYISSDNNYASFYINNNLSSTVKPNSTTITKWSLYANYLNPASKYTIEWCDIYAAQNYTYAIYDHASGLLLGQGLFDHQNTGKKCFKVDIPQLKGYAKFSGVGVDDYFNGKGLFSPSKAGKGTFDITYSWDNGNGCSGSSTQTVTVETPLADAGTDKTACRGELVKLGGSPTAKGGAGNYKYKWSPVYGISSVTNSNPTVKTDITTVYNVIVTDYNGRGCSDTAKVTVNVLTNPKANAGNDTTICKNSSIVLTAKGGKTYKWNTNETTPKINITPDVTQYYYVTISDTTVCTDKDSVLVTVTPVPLADFDFTANYPNTNNHEYTFINKSSDGNNYKWSFGDGSPEDFNQNPTHVFDTKSGKYIFDVILYVTSDNSEYCSDSVKKTIEIEIPLKITDSSNVVLLNKNKYFAIKGSFLENDSVSLKIFNRYGSVINPLNKITKTKTDGMSYILWDAKIKGATEPASAGVYFYLLSIWRTNYKIYSKQGYITVLN